ncbi:MAG: hypothetical protein ACOYN4_03805 [Bacteroidales bacterium]
MKAIFLTSILLLGAFFSFGQITFEKGYFIDNNNQRIECLIKNLQWSNSPKEFDFKVNEKNATQTATIDSLKEFGIEGSSKYMRFDTRIDRSSMDMDKLSKTRNPSWSEERLFLKVLVEGKATLYYYSENLFVRFFYKVGDSTLKQLIFKEYYAGNNEIASNPEFRQQLWMEVRCGDISIDQLRKISYSKNELTRYFTKYNTCMGGQTANENKRNFSTMFNLKLTPGINNTSISVKDIVTPERSTDFGNKFGFRFGIEAEYLLPFMKNKWGLVAEPSYMNFKASSTNQLGNATIDYQSLEIPFGVRHYFHLKDDLNIFLDAFLVINTGITFNSQILFDYHYAAPVIIKTKGSIALGAGMGYKRLSAEIRYIPEREILGGYNYWFTDCRIISFILGYSLF